MFISYDDMLYYSDLVKGFAPLGEGIYVVPDSVIDIPVLIDRDSWYTAFSGVKIRDGYWDVYGGQAEGYVILYAETDSQADDFHQFSSEPTKRIRFEGDPDFSEVEYIAINTVSGYGGQGDGSMEIDLRYPGDAAAAVAYENGEVCQMIAIIEKVNG